MITMDRATSKDITNVTSPRPSYDAVNFENCTDEVHGHRKSYLPPVYSVIFFVGSLGNILAICVYISKMRPWKSSTIIMFNLACTDLLYLISLPFLIHYHANGENWIFGDFLCSFIRFSFHFNLYSSIFFLTCFSIFRYFAIVHPITSFSVRKKSWAVAACAASWVISLIVASPVYFLITSKTVENKSLCLDLTSSENLVVIKWYTWLLSSLAFYLPLITVTLCYSVIIYTLTRGPNTQNPYKQKARKLIVLLLVVFYMCFLPFHVLRVVRIELRVYPVNCSVEKYIYIAYVISKPLAAVNTCCNLLLYVMISDNFQQAVQSLLRCKLNALIAQTGSNRDFSKSGILQL